MVSAGGSEPSPPVDWRGFNQNSHRGWAWATFPHLAGKMGRDQSICPKHQALNTLSLGPGRLRSFRVEGLR